MNDKDTSAREKEVQRGFQMLFRVPEAKLSSTKGVNLLQIKRRENCFAQREEKIKVAHGLCSLYIRFQLD